jgi:hypothetical protein
MWGDVEDVVPFVFCRGYRVIKAGSGVPKGCVDKPSLSLTSPDAPPVPDPSIPGLPVPREVANIPSFELYGLTIMRTQERDASVGTPFAVDVPNLFGLGDEQRG